MKPMSRLLCGIAVSSIAASAFAQQHPQQWNWQPERTATAENWQQVDRHASFTPPAPRGDLRSDIINNARERPEPPHNVPAQRR
jgi:hypothetical protein